MKKPKNYKFQYPKVVIVYDDIVLWDAQSKQANGPYPLHNFEVCGFLVKEYDDSYLISREVVSNQNNDLRGAMTIPKAVVKFFKKFD
jgi:hypothetical protein